MEQLTINDWLALATLAVQIAQLILTAYFNNR